MKSLKAWISTNTTLVLQICICITDSVILIQILYFQFRKNKSKQKSVIQNTDSVFSIQKIQIKTKICILKYRFCIFGIENTESVLKLQNL